MSHEVQAFRFAGAFRRSSVLARSSRRGWQQDTGRYYAPLSWGCLFARHDAWLRRLRPDADVADLARIDDIPARSAGNFPLHGSVLGA